MRAIVNIMEHILGAIFDAFLQPIFEVTCFWIGYVVTPVLTLGLIRCESWDEHLRQPDESGQEHFYFKRDGQIFLSQDATTLCGLSFSILVVIGLYFVLSTGD